MDILIPKEAPLLASIPKQGHNAPLIEALIHIMNNTTRNYSLNIDHARDFITINMCLQQNAQKSRKHTSRPFDQVPLSNHENKNQTL